MSGSQPAPQDTQVESENESLESGEVRDKEGPKSAQAEQEGLDARVEEKCPEDGEIEADKEAPEGAPVEAEEDAKVEADEAAEEDVQEAVKDARVEEVDMEAGAEEREASEPEGSKGEASEAEGAEAAAEASEAAEATPERKGDTNPLPFTPKKIESHLCMARTWNSGQGGQCTRKQVKGDYCSLHSGEGWKVHGRVDGSIPEKKLKEFYKEQNKKRGVKKEAQGASPGERCPAAEAKGSKNGKRSVEAISDEETTAESDPKKRRTNLKRTRSAQPETRSKPQAAKKPPKVSKAFKPRCTCGKPIHSEKCKLYRPSFYFGKRPRGRVPVSPKRAVPPSSVQLSRTASDQVLKICQEIERLPREERRRAWKTQMLMYHPDKKSDIPHLSEEQMNEVFVEIKRRYDFARRQPEDDRVPPARQFWGYGAR